jgi:hypothetical protein
MKNYISKKWNKFQIKLLRKAAEIEIRKRMRQKPPIIDPEKPIRPQLEEWLANDIGLKNCEVIIHEINGNYIEFMIRKKKLNTQEFTNG